LGKVIKAEQADLAMKDAYGLKRSLPGFVKHFWLVAVPEQGVNNRFDYPLGLIYLLCLGRSCGTWGKISALNGYPWPGYSLFYSG